MAPSPSLFDLPLDDLVATLESTIAGAIRAVHGVEADAVLRPSDHADFQADFAMALAKSLGAPPRVVAEAVATHLATATDRFTVEVSGPGFLNVTVNDSVVFGALRAMLTSRALGVPYAARLGTMVVDYSAPNVAKEMHVGHLRSTVIGDAIVRLLEHIGHRVVRQNHVGDWGTPFGMLIEHLLDLESDATLVGDQIQDLVGLYRDARVKFDGDEDFADRARTRVVKLQAGDEATLATWRLIVDTSAHYFQRIYDLMGVKLTLGDAAGESKYNDQLDAVCNELEQKGLAVVSDGALCVFPAGFTARSGDPLPLILRKSDGGFGYAITDLAAIKWRVQDLGAALVVYVVGSPQRQHLAMVFQVARDAGWLEHSDAVHVPFGSVLGRDGKMFKTRSGETVRLENLLDEAVERAGALVTERNPDLTPAELDRISRSVGMAAVKFADLKNQRMKDYVFDLDEMVAIEGDTGPYLQYTHARTRALLRRLGTVETEVTLEGGLGEHERALALLCTGYPRAVNGSIADFAPHVVCGYLIRVARAFNSMYAESRITDAPDSPERRARIFLTLMTAEVLEAGLTLLGIDAPGRV